MSYLFPTSILSDLFRENLWRFGECVHLATSYFGIDSGRLKNIMRCEEKGRFGDRGFFENLVMQWFLAGVGMRWMCGINLMICGREEGREGGSGWCGEIVACAAVSLHHRLIYQPFPPAYLFFSFLFFLFLFIHACMHRCIDPFIHPPKYIIFTNSLTHSLTNTITANRVL